MHWSFCQQDENCIALNYRIAHFFGVDRWPYRYKDIQEKRELPGKVYVYIYMNKVLSDERLGTKLTENRCILSNSLTYVCMYVCMYIYIYKYYERKKRRNYISRQACFVNRFTLQGFNV